MLLEPIILFYKDQNCFDYDD